MSSGMTEIWVYLSAQPLLWLSLTLAAYLVALTLHRKAGAHPAVNPVLLSVLILVGLLVATGTPYQHYFDGAQFVHFLLGPTTVALAIPLHGQLKRLLAMGGPLLIALVVISADFQQGAAQAHGHRQRQAEHLVDRSRGELRAGRGRRRAGRGQRRGGHK